MPKFHSLEPRVLACLALTVVSMAIFAGCGILSDPGYVVYAVGNQGSRDIAVIQPTGSGQQVVIGGSSDNFAPVWSPDKQRIAFLSNRAGNVEIYVASADGSGVMRITDTAVAESHVVWSPDGTRLAYVSPDYRGIPQVYWLRLSDLLPHHLAFNSVGQTDPAWSPDGAWIAFVALDQQGNELGIQLRNPDGVNQIRVTDGPDSSPVWSPDGKQLAFVASNNGQEEIYVVSIGQDGAIGQPHQITDGPGHNYAPRWSPDGKRIVFLSTRDGNANVYTVSSRGTDLRQITQSNVSETAATWGPDGQIVFESPPAGHPSLFIVDKNGSQRALTPADQIASEPDW